MRAVFFFARKTCGVLLALWLANLYAAEPVSPLIGLTREELLVKFGEPKSQIAVGDRVVFLYARDRIVLRNDKVIEVEALPVDVPRRAAPDPAPVAPAPVAPTPVPAAPAPAPESAARSSPPAAPGPTAPVAANPTPPPSSTTSEPKVEIKLVRPPGSKELPSVPRPETPPSRSPEVAPPSQSVSPRPASSGASKASVTPPRSDAPEPSVSPQTEAQAKAFDAAVARDKKAARRRLDEAVALENAPGLVSGNTVLVGLLILGGGAALLIWRFRQRQLELAATSVANTPLVAVPAAPPVPTQPKADPSVFTEQLLAQLDFKRFDELVAAYYSKTGVVAARTMNGPEAPVQVKISWKGEPRPFAYVQCILGSSTVVEAKPLQALLEVLAADDIRRGHVVTTGRFGPSAIKLAEEKRITLLPGDAFLEKLNALPPAARLEIMKVIGAVA